VQPARAPPQQLSSFQPGAFTNGDRFRAGGLGRRKRNRDDSPEPIRHVPIDAKPTRESNRSRKRVNYAEAEAFADITDDEGFDDGNNSDEERKLKAKNAVAAFDDTSEFDDEVERVLAHRCASDYDVFCIALSLCAGAKLSITQRRRHMRTSPTTRALTTAATPMKSAS
jgi:hypothetical protein